MSEDGAFLGCVTDNLPDNRQISVPMFAKLCSAICYIREEDKRKQVIPFHTYNLKGKIGSWWKLLFGTPGRKFYSINFC